MLFYTDKTDIELLLKSVSRKFKIEDYVLFGHGDIVCSLEIREHCKLLYISWSVDSSDCLAKEGLAVALENIDSVTLDEDCLSICADFDCTLNEKLTGNQTRVFDGKIGRLVRAVEFESLLEQEEIEINNELTNICLH